ncbi:hypothetical protein [Calothrix sp. NIES-3974]|nr:hypothetical protein [Calothrix sp. NIES-3974]BAZ04534.1 hypothetical protein NIES3974_11730 [Calothrix sp. NIES-3974]
MAGLSEFRNLIPKLYQDCGELFVSQKQPTQAIALYEKFLDQFPVIP